MMLFEQIFKNRTAIHWRNDIISGIIVALVSIPISMGYAQIAGLPAVYGLYGSILPILIFAFLTTSPQFVVGVDAMPAVMVGSLMAELGFISESYEAKQLAPIMAILTGLVFIAFYFVKAGRVVKYISIPVMGGFISGIGLTIIFMQIPKLFGGQAGTGEIIELISNIIEQLQSFNMLSFVISIVVITIILLGKKYIPKIPMTIVMLVLGAIAQVLFHLDKYGVKLLPEVTAGLPKPMIPDVGVIGNNWSMLVIQAISIAGVIMAQTLLASGNYAMKYNYKIDNNRELLAYGAMNFASGFSGVCPINGSVSRSGIADSNGCKSQVMSVTASLTMVIVVLFFTPYLKYLPVPVLTAIVMTALIGILDIEMAKRLWKSNKNELLVFLASMFAVLLFGTVNGVIFGVILSFGEVAVRAVNPPATFIGRIPGHGNYHSLNRNSNAKAIKGAVIYRFNGNLFFANIDKFISTLSGAIRKDTKVVIVDARGVSSFDITSVDKIVQLNKNLREQGIRFYITEHDGSLNDQLRMLGGGNLIDSGSVRQTITLALRDSGYEKPYPLEDADAETILEESGLHTHDIRELTEFEWLYGDKAQDKLAEMADIVAEELSHEETIAEAENEILDGHGVHTTWGMISLFDEENFLELLDKRLHDMEKSGRLSLHTLEEIEMHIEARRKAHREHIHDMEPRLREILTKHKDRISKLHSRIHNQ